MAVVVQTPVEHRFYATVSANDSEEDTYTPATGKTLVITEAGGHSVYLNSVKVQICWVDVECLFVTHGDANDEINKSFSTDGTKYMRILLQNDSDSAETIGGWWKGYYY